MSKICDKEQRIDLLNRLSEVECQLTQVRNKIERRTYYSSDGVPFLSTNHYMLLVDRTNLEDEQERLLDLLYGDN